MNSRRRFCAALGAAALAPTISCAATARYPSRPVRLLVGVEGGAQDTVARMMTDWLSRRLGQPFVVEPRPGAGGNIATELVVRAAPDGQTLLFVGAPSAIGATLYPKLGFNFLRDIAPVGSIMRTPEVLAAHPAVPARNAMELIRYARSNPGKLFIASPGEGTGPHMSAELLKMMASLEIVHVPYRGGGPAMIDLLAGRVHLLFIAPLVALPHLRTGRLRALAITSAARSVALPEVQPLTEILPGFESGGFFGIGAPRATPASVIAALNAEINAGLRSDAIDARIREMGADVLGGSPEEFGRLLAAETEKWARVIRYAGITAGA